MPNTTVEYDLKEVLTEINGKLDQLSKDVKKLEIEMATVNTKMNTFDETSKDVKQLVRDVSDLKGAKSFIIPIVVAVTTSVVTLIIRAIPVHF